MLLVLKKENVVPDEELQSNLEQAEAMGKSEIRQAVEEGKPKLALQLITKPRVLHRALEKDGLKKHLTKSRFRITTCSEGEKCFESIDVLPHFL